MRGKKLNKEKKCYGTYYLRRNVSGGKGKYEIIGVNVQIIEKIRL
jgi:hypothetical protein